MKKMSIVLSVFVLLSILLSACTTPATTEVPVVDEPTEEVVAEDPLKKSSKNLPPCF